MLIICKRVQIDSFQVIQSFWVFFSVNFKSVECSSKFLLLLLLTSFCVLFHTWINKKTTSQFFYLFYFIFENTLVAVCRKIRLWIRSAWLPQWQSLRTRGETGRKDSQRTLPRAAPRWKAPKRGLLGRPQRLPRRSHLRACRPTSSSRSVINRFFLLWACVQYCFCLFNLLLLSF